MAYISNTNLLLQRLKAIRTAVDQGNYSDALIAGLNAGMGIMKRRIFNQSLDANGESLGPYYSEQYERDRLRSGRQVARKDLEFQGSLRRSIEVVVINGRRAEVRITNLENALIAGYQEQQIYNLRNGLPANEASGGKVPIFQFSLLETQIADNTTRALLQQKFAFL